MNTKQPPAKQPPKSSARKYDIHLADGRVWTCIDLANDPPDEVERGIREMFGKYGIKAITR